MNSAATKPYSNHYRLDIVNAVADTVPATRDLVPANILATVATACDRSEQLRLDYRDRHQGCSYRRVSRTGSCTSADAGTWWPTTSTGTIGERSVYLGALGLDFHIDPN